jgi:DNA-directed RNA polymerase subunit alpha
MIQFEYNKIMKRYDVKVPWQLGDGSDQVIVGSISKDNRMTVHGDLSLQMLKQIIMHWDEYEHMEERREKREKEKDKEYARWELKHDLSKSVDELDFTIRTHNCLQSRGIRTIGELVEKSERDIRRIKNCGRKSLTEIEEKLSELGLTLK